MAKANLGTKRVCPESGRKFYDLDKDPIVSPYTGNEYPLSFFEADTNITAPKPDEVKEVNAKEEVKPAEEVEETEEVVLDDDAPEIISLDEAEDDTADDADGDDEIPDIPDIPDVDIEDDEEEASDDTFLEDDDENDDLSDVIVKRGDNDDEV